MDKKALLAAAAALAATVNQQVNIEMTHQTIEER